MLVGHMPNMTINTLWYAPILIFRENFTDWRPARSKRTLNLLRLAQGREVHLLESPVFLLERCHPG